MTNEKKIEWVLDPSSCPGFLRHQLVDEVRKSGQISYTEYLFVKIPARYGLVNVTDLVESVLERSAMRDGFCFVSAMHITAGIYVNDAESGLLQDLSEWLDRLAPFGRDYLHHQTGEDNGDAHLKSFLTNHFATLPVTKGRLDLGTWQQIFYAEFDGLREKRLLVKCTGMHF